MNIIHVQRRHKENVSRDYTTRCVRYYPPTTPPEQEDIMDWRMVRDQIGLKRWIEAFKQLSQEEQNKIIGEQLDLLEDYKKIDPLTVDLMPPQVAKPLLRRAHRARRHQG